ncbi:MAG: ATP-binding cassette domain-containing protein [Geminicoccaceae bacterium]
MLAVEQIVSVQGKARWVDGVSFAVPQAKTIALFDPWPRSRAAMIEVLAGQRRVSSGTIRLHDIDITRLGASARLRLGVVRSFQPKIEAAERTIFAHVAASLSLRSGGDLAGLLATETDRRQSDEVSTILAKTGLSELADHPPTGLPQNYSIQLELARCLALRPRLLILDRPSAGLSAPDRQRLIAYLNALGQDGVALIVVEEDVNLIAALTNRALIMRQGKLVADGPIETQGERSEQPWVIAGPPPERFGSWAARS